MLDSVDVLSALHVVYTVYAVAIILLFGWLAFKLTGGKPKGLLSPKMFYSYIALLVFVGVTIHILTFNTIPWVPSDLKRGEIKPDQTFHIEVANHKFILPQDKLTIECGKTVLFDIDSKDLTYGFGLVRHDESLVFQIQVVPGSKNTLLWQFHKNGTYNIRSTEYSGPKGAAMKVEGAVEVVGCKDTDPRAS